MYCLLAEYSRLIVADHVDRERWIIRHFCAVSLPVGITVGLEITEISALILFNSRGSLHVRLSRGYSVSYRFRRIRREQRSGIRSGPVPYMGRRCTSENPHRRQILCLCHDIVHRCMYPCPYTRCKGDRRCRSILGLYICSSPCRHTCRTLRHPCRSR